MSHPRRMGRGLRSSLGLIAGSRGFSLIELLVVIIILGLLAGLVGPRLFGRVRRARRAREESQRTELERTLSEEERRAGGSVGQALPVQVLSRRARRLRHMDPWSRRSSRRRRRERRRHVVDRGQMIEGKTRGFTL